MQKAARCPCGVCANLELVDKFCYLGDILSVGRDADAAGGQNLNWIE